MGDAGALGMRGKRADLSGLVFGNLTVLRTCYRLEVPQMLLARARELASGHPGLMSALEVFCLGLWAPALQPGCIGRPAWVGASFEQAGLVIGNDRADRASQPCPVGPPFDLVAKAAECVSG